MGIEVERGEIVEPIPAIDWDIGIENRIFDVECEVANDFLVLVASPDVDRSIDVDGVSTVVGGIVVDPERLLATSGVISAIVEIRSDAIDAARDVVERIRTFREVLCASQDALDIVRSPELDLEVIQRIAVPVRDVDGEVRRIGLPCDAPDPGTGGQLTLGESRLAQDEDRAARNDETAFL